MSKTKSDYMKYLKVAESRKDLKLCPRGYATAKVDFKVFPSAYANGYAAQVCNGTKPDFNGIYKKDYKIKKSLKSSLTRWYNEKWVNVCEKDREGNYLPCGRKDAKLKSKEYPYCRPLYKLPTTPVKSVNELTQKDLKKMCKIKRSLKQGVEGKPTFIYLRNL